MPTIGHLAVGLAAGRYIARNDEEVPKAMGLGMALATLPDWDLLSNFVTGTHDTMAGHRGAVHSLLAAAVIGVSVGLWLGPRLWGRSRTAAWAVATIASHGVLDVFNVGSKVALLWPWNDRFITVPWQFIPGVLSTADLLTSQVVPVLLAEAVIFSPFVLYAFWKPLLRWLKPEREAVGPSAAS